MFASFGETETEGFQRDALSHQASFVSRVPRGSPPYSQTELEMVMSEDVSGHLLRLYTSFQAQLELNELLINRVAHLESLLGVLPKDVEGSGAAAAESVVASATTGAVESVVESATTGAAAESVADSETAAELVADSETAAESEERKLSSCASAAEEKSPPARIDEEQSKNVTEPTKDKVLMTRIWILLQQMDPTATIVEKKTMFQRILTSEW